MVIDKVVNVLIKYNYFSIEEYDDCKQVLLSIIGNVCTYLSVFLVAIFTKTLIPTIIYFLFFRQLRTRTGGFHANTRRGCYIGTMGIYVLCIEVFSRLIVRHLLIGEILLGVSAIVIFVFAPVNHPNLDLDENEILLCKKSLRRVLFIEIFYVIVMRYLKTNIVFEVYAILGIVTCALLLIISKTIGQEVKCR